MDLFDYMREQTSEKESPLASRLRPTTLEEVVGQQSRGDRKLDHLEQGVGQVEQAQQLGLYGNDKEYNKPGFRVHGGKAEYQAQMEEIGHEGGIVTGNAGGNIGKARGGEIEEPGVAVKDHGVKVHQQDAAQVVEVELAGAPSGFYRPAQGIGAVKGDQSHQKIAAGEAEDVGHQPPDLALEDQSSVKAEDIIQPCESQQGQGRHHTAADDDIQHQVGDALVAVAIAEALEISAQIFQWTQLPKSIYNILTGNPPKVYSRIVNISAK